jgi:hypothetical protein
MREAINGILALDATKDDAVAAGKIAGNAAQSGRIGVLVSVARISTEYQMTDIAADSVVRAIVAEHKDKSTFKTVQTLASEIRLAAKPEVRMHVEDLVTLAMSAWQQEEDDKLLDKTLPQPLKVAFTRKYHCAIALLREAAKFGRIYSNTEEVIALARHLDPAYDAEKIAKQRDSVTKALQGLIANCAHPALANIASDLAQVTEDELAKYLRNRPMKPVLSFDLPTVVEEEPKEEVVVTKPTLPTTVHKSAPAQVAMPVISDVVADILDVAA